MSAQAVGDAERDVGRLVLAEQDHFLAARDLGRTTDDDPMFGTMMVHLQGERGAGADDDALDLEALAAVDAVVPAPRAMHLAMEFGFATAGSLEPTDDGLDLLGALLGRDQHGIGGFNHHHVLAADAGDQPVLGHDQVAGGILEPDVAGDGVVVAVVAYCLPQGIPGADVRPADIERDHLRGNAQLRAGRQLLHDGVVDGIGRAGAKAAASRRTKSPSSLAWLTASRQAASMAGGEMSDGLEPDRGTQQEDAAVPEVAPAGHIGSRRGGVGLLAEGADGARRACRRIAAPTSM
jgi:hypothetical protein